MDLVPSGDIVDTAIAPSPSRADTKLIAPLWHTLIVVLFLLTLSAWGARSHSPLPLAERHGHIRGYLIVIAIEWLLVGLVWYGVHLRKVHLRELIGGDGITFLRIMRDLGIAILFLIGSNLVLATTAYLLKATRNPAVRSLVPSGRQEVVIYLLLSLSAGICEEIVCRGYLQKQFTALTKNVWAGVAIQGAIFGAAHGYQGPKMMLVIVVYGCLFGLLALWRKSLQPGMMTHALQDGLVGLLAR